MGPTNENVGPKILAKIKIYVLTRAELLFQVCYEIPCKYPTLLCQFCYNPLQLKILGICYSLQSCPATMIYCETLLLNLYIIPFMTRRGQKSSIISVAIFYSTQVTVPIPHLLKKTCKSRFANMFVITCTSLQFAPVKHNDPESKKPSRILGQLVGK